MCLFLLWSQNRSCLSVCWNFKEMRGLRTNGSHFVFCIPCLPSCRDNACTVQLTPHVFVRSFLVVIYFHLLSSAVPIIATNAIKSIILTLHFAYLSYICQVMFLRYTFKWKFYFYRMFLWIIPLLEIFLLKFCKSIFIDQTIVADCHKINEE